MGSKLNWRSICTAAVAAVAALTLAACGRDGGGATVLKGQAGGLQLEARQPTSKRAAEASSKDFAFLRYSIDVSKDLPRACLSFSGTLDKTKDYAPYVEASAGSPLVFAVEGQQLCIGGLTFGKEREITLRSGLPSGDGRALKFDETINVEFGDRPAFVGFKGDGVILPRVEADGLAIETVNVPAVQVKISRITDRALAFKTISAGYSSAQGEYGYMNFEEDPTDLAEKVWEGSMDTPGSVNQAKTTVFPIATAIGRLKPGAYFIELDQKNASGKTPENAARAKRWLIITDLALTTYSGADGMSATVRSLQTAKPMAGVRLELVAKNNQVLAKATSDGDGHIRVPGPAMKGEGPMEPRLLMAYADNGDFTVLDLARSPVDLTERDIGGREPSKAADAFIYLDRGVYRPGETVRANALLRDPASRALSNRKGALVVYRPNGIEAGRMRFDSAPNAGAVRWDYELPKSAARGDWRLAAEVEGIGQIASHSFSVEDFVPQRIALKLDVDKTSPLRAQQSRQIQANVRFLYGAPGAGLPIETSVRVETDPDPFPALKGYSFGRLDEEFRETSFDIPAATTDGAGRAALLLRAQDAKAESSKPLRMHAVVSAIEPGGRAVRDDARIPYRPNDRYVGVKPKFEDRSTRQGQKAEFEVASIDPTGALKAAEINWRLVRIDWKYDWYREANGGQWTWRRSRQVVEIETGTARTEEGKAGAITTRELDWGDYQLMLTEAKSGAEGGMAFWSGWGGQPQAGVEAPDRVRMVAPTKLPAVGQDVEITLTPPYTGEAEIVVASENVLTTRTLQVKENQAARIKLPVTKDWGAGVYVMTSIYTPRDAVQRPRPRRAVGVVHIGVDVTDRTFKLEMKAPQIARPRAKATVEIAATGGPVRDGAWLTLAAVDEGILLLTGYETPDPAKYFFGKRRLGVALRDDYGRLLDPNQGAASAVRVGGDQLGGAGLSVVPTKSVALYSGPVKFNPAGKASITFDVPDFNGELRLMAVAWSETGVGSAGQPLTVRDPVTAELILPRFLAPGDQAQGTVTLDNTEGAVGTYAASITSTGPAGARDEKLSASLKQKERRDLAATLGTTGTGVSNLALSIAGPNGFKVTHAYPIETRSPYLPASAVVRKTLAPGETFTPAPNALSGYTPGSSSTQISFSPIPMDAAALFDSLERYPYGCTEQIVSRAMPLLYAQQMAALAGRKSPGDLKTQVQEAVSTIVNRQGADGAIGLWRTGDREASPWLGAYATDFLARAKSAGYVVPDAAIDRAYDALEAFAVREQTFSTGYEFKVFESKYHNDTDQKLLDRSSAYAAYVLARAGRMDKSRLRYLHDDRINRMESPLARAQIGAALAMIGDKSRSKSAFDKANAALGYQNTGDYYQTPRRDLAGVLALAAEAGDAARVQGLAEKVGQDLPEPDRLSTQEKAFLLLAANALSGGATEVNVGVQGKATVVTAGRVFSLSESQAQTPPGFTNSGKSPLWVTAISRGAPSSAPPPAAEGLRIDKAIYTTQGSRAESATYTQGDRMIVRIEVTPTSNRRTPLVVADLLPAGFEIEAVLKPEDAGKTGVYSFLGDLTGPNIAEARDDRFVAAVDVYDGKSARFAYVVRAVTPGSFAMPGAVSEDMYRPDVFARTTGRAITVAPRK